jgi:hypothetical protein
MTLEELEEQIARMKEHGAQPRSRILIQIPSNLDGWTQHRFSTNFAGEGPCHWRAIEPHAAAAIDIEGVRTCVVFIDY